MRLERQVSVRHLIGSSAYRRRTAVVSTQVLLWRMLLISCVAFGSFVIFIRPHMACMYGPKSKSEETKMLVRQFAFEAFPQWAAVHHMDSCPSSLSDLTEYTNHNSIADAWGNPLEMKCGLWIRGIYVRSAGEDGRFDTADDISSNDTTSDR